MNVVVVLNGLVGRMMIHVKTW